MSKQNKITSYSLFQTKIVEINELKQVNVLCFRQIDIVQFPTFVLSKALEFLNFLAGLVLNSYKSVSYKKNVCATTSISKVLW